LITFAPSGASGQPNSSESIFHAPPSLTIPMATARRIVAATCGAVS
jgi:hypothetical protein